MKISSIWDATNVCHLHRTRYPFAYLQQDFPYHEFELSLIDVSEDLDVLWLYGAYKLENMTELMKLKRRGVKLVFGLDDNYWSFPEWRTDKPSDLLVGVVDMLAVLADHIVVSTPKLKEAVGHLDKTTVGPNLLDVAAYRTPKPPEKDDEIRILWAGSATHKGDLAHADKACCEILKKITSGGYNKPVHFFFVGYAPDQVVRDYWNNCVTYVPWVPLCDYWHTLSSIKPHIVLAPLDDNPFNLCKSAIRCQEAWALNAAHVYSPVGEYNDVNVDGQTGLKASSTEEWTNKIDTLIKDNELRHYLCKNGYEKVKSEWNWRNVECRKKWYPTMEKVFCLKDKRANPNTTTG